MDGCGDATGTVSVRIPKRNVIISSILAENAINNQRVHVMGYTSMEDIVEDTETSPT